MGDRQCGFESHRGWRGCHYQSNDSSDGANIIHNFSCWGGSSRDRSWLKMKVHIVSQPGSYQLVALKYEIYIPVHRSTLVNYCHKTNQYKINKWINISFFQRIPTTARMLIKMSVFSYAIELYSYTATFSW